MIQSPFRALRPSLSHALNIFTAIQQITPLVATYATGGTGDSKQQQVAWRMVEQGNIIALEAYPVVYENDGNVAYDRKVISPVEQFFSGGVFWALQGHVVFEIADLHGERVLTSQLSIIPDMFYWAGSALTKRRNEHALFMVKMASSIMSIEVTKQQLARFMESDEYWYMSSPSMAEFPSDSLRRVASRVTEEAKAQDKENPPAPMVEQQGPLAGFRVDQVRAAGAYQMITSTRQALIEKYQWLATDAPPAEMLEATPRINQYNVTKFWETSTARTRGQSYIETLARAGGPFPPEVFARLTELRTELDALCEALRLQVEESLKQTGGKEALTGDVKSSDAQDVYGSQEVFGDIWGNRPAHPASSVQASGQFKVASDDRQMVQIQVGAGGGGSSISGLTAAAGGGGFGTSPFATRVDPTSPGGNSLRQWSRDAAGQPVRWATPEDTKAPLQDLLKIVTDRILEDNKNTDPLLVQLEAYRNSTTDAAKLQMINNLIAMQGLSLLQAEVRAKARTMNTTIAEAYDDKVPEGSLPTGLPEQPEIPPPADILPENPEPKGS